MRCNRWIAHICAFSKYDDGRGMIFIPRGHHYDIILEQSEISCDTQDFMRKDYTLSHPENDREVTERAQGYTMQDASFMRQSRCSFLNAFENTQVARAMTSTR